MSSRRQQKEEARARRVAREAEIRAAAARRRRLTRLVAGTVTVAVLGGGIALASAGGGRGARSGAGASAGTAGAIGPEGVPIEAGPPLAPAAAADGRPVDGISCLGGEQIAYHIHARLTVFVNGAARQIPGGIGIVAPQSQSTPNGAFVAGGSCFYFLHTHAADGIVHIESPVERTYTLGDFFDVWRQPLGEGEIGPARGPVLAYVNGRRYGGDPRTIPLAAHAQITLEIGRPQVAPPRITFPPGL